MNEFVYERQLLIGTGEVSRKVRIFFPQNPDGCRFLANLDIDITYSSAVHFSCADQFHRNLPSLQVEGALPESQICVKVRDRAMKE